MKQMQAGQFKAQCLKVMDEVSKTKRSVIITKRNRPVAKIVPMSDSKNLLFGKMKGTGHIMGDILQPIGEEKFSSS